jgi:hypothetical protein
VLGEGARDHQAQVTRYLGGIGFADIDPTVTSIPLTAASWARASASRVSASAREVASSPASVAGGVAVEPAGKPDGGGGGCAARVSPAPDKIMTLTNSSKGSHRLLLEPGAGFEVAGV